MMLKRGGLGRESCLTSKAAGSNLTRSSRASLFSINS